MARPHLRSSTELQLHASTLLLRIKIPEHAVSGLQAEDDSDKEETEPSDVDMSGSDSEDEAPCKPARGRKGKQAAAAGKKAAKKASIQNA